MFNCKILFTNANGNPVDRSGGQLIANKSVKDNYYYPDSTIQIESWGCEFFDKFPDHELVVYSESIVGGFKILYSVDELKEFVSLLI